MKFKLALIVAIIYTAIVYFAHFVFKYDILHFNWIFIFPIILMAYYDFNAGIYYSIAVNFTKLSFVADSYSKGEKYTREMLSIELGVSNNYIYTILVGKRIMTFKMADMIEQATAGALKAEDLLQESIAMHKKWLEREKNVTVDPSKTT